MKKNRRPQAQKDRVAKVQDLRRSNAAQPIPSRKAYKRPKAGARNKEW